MMIDCTHDFVHLLKSSNESTHDFLGKITSIKDFTTKNLHILFFRLVQQSKFENHL